VKKITGLLREWGLWVIRYIDHADEYGENILHRCATSGASAVADRLRECRSVPLHPHMPPELQQVARAVKKLRGWQLKCVVVYYCAPLHDGMHGPCGQPWTKRELAKVIGLHSSERFDSHLDWGKNKVQSLIDAGV